MTNFEKWKKDLKPEELILYDPHTWRDCVQLTCDNCPVSKTCKLNAQRQKAMKTNDSWSVWCGLFYTVKHLCRQSFEEWANKEADDDEL